MKPNRKRSICAIVLSGLALTGASVAGAAPSGPSVRLNALDRTVLAQMNVVRRAHSLRPLTLSSSLSRAADGHTSEMGQAGYFAHASADRTIFWKRIEQSYSASGHRTWSVGENLLFMSPDIRASDVIRSWMNSPAHRANLLDPTWREVGIAARHYRSAPAFYSGQAVTILTADFGVRT
jgi:uncharacterized protein YkwD